MLRLPIMLLFLIFILYFVFSFIKSIVIDIKKRSFKRALIKVVLSSSIIVSLNFFVNYSVANRIPTSLNKNVRQYVINVNQVKSDSVGTKIFLKKAFMDINNISFTLGAKGKSKVVAVETKKNPEDKEPLSANKGLWLGNSLTYEYMGMGNSYSGSEFLEEIYIICYLSSGEEIIFKLEDKNNIKEKVEIIQIDKELDYEGKKVRMKTLTRGLNYTSLSVVSDIGFFTQKFYIIQDGKEFESRGGGGSGGNHSFSFDPIKKEDITIKLVNKNLSKEDIVKVR